ncbi:hypothetical protein E3Q17_02811 [Wallemia mellicola]|uniref:Nitrogen regulatory protein areA GATA-like domain-containing protein n=1 Tax=Wallemia mellicola TaxID=1708541 RepID=A0A4V4MM22_9BASI|nr:hypothetical protein E3Q17_02811 [Wallemia mellicola]TIC69307.1 hypothetical protein E3Q03_01418 [Wallemia mellicola]
MAQFVPSPASVNPEATGHAPDDADAQTRLPSICVDYLSHDWEEEDVWTSWRSMTRHKNDIANGVRLENASWRTWWKQRNKLKTISPETLNWLKDSDVTWLYGPLHTAVDPVPQPKASTLEDHIDLDQGHGTKPILKHRTISELLTMPNQSSPSIEAIPDDEQSDVPSDYQSDASVSSAASPIESKRPKFPHSHSEPLIKTALHNSDTINQHNNDLDTASPASKLMSPNATNSDGDASNTSSMGSKRHITFNSFVEQRISLDEPERIADEALASDEDEVSSEDEGLTFRSRSLSNNTSKSRTRSSSAASDLSSIPAPDHITIAEIEPTTLKINPHGLDEDDSSFDIIQPPNDSNPDYVPTARRSSFYNNSSDEDDDQEQSTAAFRSEAPPLASPAHGFLPQAWEDNDEFDYFSGKFDDFDDDEDNKVIEDISKQPVQAHHQPNVRKGVLKKSPSYDRNVATIGAVPSTAVGPEPSEERGRRL